MAISTVQEQSMQQISPDFGADFLLDKNYDPVLLATGEPVMTSGAAAVAQDVRMAMQTPKGSLFYDPDFGSDLLYYVNDEQTSSNTRHLQIDIQDCIYTDPRVDFNSVQVQVAPGTEKITADCSFDVANINNQYRIEIGQTVEVL